MEALRETNKFLQEEEPWMRKSEEDRPRRLEAVRVCLEAIYCVSHLLVAFLPTACTRVFEKLGECAALLPSQVSQKMVTVPVRAKYGTGILCDL